MQIQFYRSSRIIENIEKIFLTKEERSALQSLMDLPEELQSIVEDKIFFVNRLTFKGSQINADGYPISPDFRLPIVWLNSPAVCKAHLAASLDNQLKMVYRRPKLNTSIRYDFPRLLISKSFVKCNLI
jgi:hypothetical protein